MSRLLIHIGTGTIIDLDDDCVFIDMPDSLEDADEDEIVDYAKEYGVPVNTSVHPDVNYGNVVCYSPSALREEAREIVADISDPITREALEFVINQATDKELNEMASFILNGDTVWTAYREDILEGARVAHGWRKEKS